MFIQLIIGWPLQTLSVVEEDLVLLHLIDITKLYSIKLLATLAITKMIVNKINTTNYISDNIMSCATYVNMQHK